MTHAAITSGKGLVLYFSGRDDGKEVAGDFNAIQELTRQVKRSRCNTYRFIIEKRLG